MNHTTIPDRFTLPQMSMRHWIATPRLIGGAVIAVIAVQIWSATSVMNRTMELRKVLSDGHAAANQLERRLGYGGLIHDFKNYVLRPDEDGYRISALANADEALVLLERLSESTESFGIKARLNHTREMIQSYTERLERVRELSLDGRSSRFVDERVRFDDQPALQEVGVLLDRLDTAVDARLVRLQRQGTLTTLFIIVITATLGVCLAAFVSRRQRRHAKTLGTLTETLTERNAELVKANTSLSQFAGIVSHDLRSPLRHLNLFSDMIVEDRDDAKAVESHVANVNRLVGQMESIIESLLDFTKTGFTQPRFEAIDLAALLADIKRDLRPALDTGGARVDLDVDLEESIQADPELLSRVFSNLIGNGLKYARAETNSRILVHAAVDGERVLCSVSDNGIGIDARFATMIFEPLQRLHGPQSSYEGVGIGLSIVKSIIESHGGSIWLDTGYTRGTRITFSLPIAPRDEHRHFA